MHFRRSDGASDQLCSHTIMDCAVGECRFYFRYTKNLELITDAPRLFYSHTLVEGQCSRSIAVHTDLSISVQRIVILPRVQQRDNSSPDAMGKLFQP